MSTRWGYLYLFKIIIALEPIELKFGVNVWNYLLYRLIKKVSSKYNSDNQVIAKKLILLILFTIIDEYNEKCF